MKRWERKRAVLRLQDTVNFNNVDIKDFVCTQGEVLLLARQSSLCVHSKAITRPAPFLTVDKRDYLVNNS